MKAKVLIQFRDKYTGEIHAKDSFITVTKKRFAEILANGEEKGMKLVEEVVEEAKTDTKASKKASKKRPSK